MGYVCCKQSHLLHEIKARVATFIIRENAERRILEANYQEHFKHTIEGMQTILWPKPFRELQGKLVDEIPQVWGGHATMYSEFPVRRAKFAEVGFFYYFLNKILT